MTTAELIRIAAKKGVIVSPVAAAVLVGDTKPRVHLAESYGVDQEADTVRVRRPDPMAETARQVRHLLGEED